MRLLPVCWLIDQAIGRGDAESDLKAVLGLCAQLGFTEDQVQAMLQDTAAAYSRDRGQSLIAQAFEGL